MIRSWAGSLALVGALPTLVGGALADETPPEPGVRIDTVGEWRRLHAVLPGSLVSYALPRVAQGQRRIVVLVRPIVEQPEEGAEDSPARPPCPERSEREPPPLVLYRIDAAQPTGMVVLHDNVPADITAIDTVDLDGDGNDELLLASTGELFLLDDDGRGEIESVLAEPALRWRALHPRSVRTPGLDGWTAVPTHAYSTLGIHGPVDGQAGWERLASIDLPLGASVSRRGLRISSMNPRFIGRATDGTLLFGTPVESHGQRLHTKLIEIADNGEGTVTDCWSRLPTPETVLEQRFVMLDGHPVLVVTTKPSDKLNLFGEKELRLFPVERDLSRLGRNPLLAIQTRVNLWQAVTPILVDVNRDGRSDLILGYWKGLKDNRVVLDAYMREEDGSFANNPHTTSFDVEEGDRSFVEYGRDLDGDDLADLLIGTESGGLMLYSGLPSKAGKKLVSREHRELPLDDVTTDAAPTAVTVSIGGAATVEMASSDRPRFADLDGDGRDELLVVIRGGSGRPGRLLTLSPGVKDGGLRP